MLDFSLSVRESDLDLSRPTHHGDYPDLSPHGPQEMVSSHANFSPRAQAGAQGLLAQLGDVSHHLRACQRHSLSLRTHSAHQFHSSQLQHIEPGLQHVNFCLQPWRDE